MKKVVFCWELGSNYGHITSLLPLCRALRAKGVAVDFIVRELMFAEQFLGGQEGVHYFQAPLLNGLPPDVMGNTYSYADILARAGYLDATQLHSCVTAWRNLFDLLDADLILADHAPTALLAARTLDLPAVLFGSGFLNPPMQDPFPLFHVWSGVPDNVLLQHYLPLLTNINATLRHFQVEPLGRLADIFNVAERFLCTTPELDHYFVRNDEDYWGPSYTGDQGMEPEWPRGDGPRIFAYLTTKIKSLDRLLAELGQLNASVLIHIPNCTSDLRGRYESASLRIESAPLKMSSVFESAALVINQAGVGTASACMMAGVRQLLVPTQLEQRMLCKKLVAQKLAYGVDPESATPAYGTTILQALACPQLGERLSQFTRHYAGYDHHQQYTEMAEVVDHLLNSHELN